MRASLSDRLARFAWIRPLLIWLGSAFVLASLAGDKRFAWSHNTHFAHLAQDLYAGHWTHDSPPPGYCSAKAKRAKKCKYHQFDDWAQARSLVLDQKLARELDLRPTLWAMPCKSSACQQDASHRAHRWWIPGRGLTKLPAGRYRLVSKTWFVSFPPGPALWFLIPLWLGLPMLPDIPLTWMLAATIPVSLDLATRRRWPGLSKRWSLGLALACLFASAMLGISVQGQVWFLAQISFAALLSAGLAAWFMPGKGAPWLASLCWALALACRPSTALGVLLTGFVLARRACDAPSPAQQKRVDDKEAPSSNACSEHEKQVGPQKKRSWKAPLGSPWIIFLGPMVSLATMARWNWQRFGSVTEFGHHFLEIRWMQRIQTLGLFDSSYLAKNVLSFFCLPLRSISPLMIPIHGLGWLWSTPWILWLSFKRRNDWALLACVVLGVAPALFYQNTGQLQLSYRFALDLLPVWVLAVAPNAASRPRSTQALVLHALLLHCALSWAWVHHPAWVFGTRATNWPFTSS